MRRQVGRVVAAIAVVGALVAGCGSGPTQAGTAVIVGDEGVPIEVVQSRLDVALGKPDLVGRLAAQGIGAPEIARDIVTRVVMHELLTRAAADEGIVVTEQEIDAELAAGGGVEAAVASSLYDEATLRDRVRDQLIAIRLGELYADRLSVTADLFASTSREGAEEAARVIAAGGPAADALFAANAENTQRGSEYRASTNPELASTVLFGTPEGGTVVFQPSPEQNRWLVLHITGRSTDAPPLEPGAAPDLSQAQLAGIGERLMQPLADEVGIRVNPRYGVWAPIPLRVLDEELATGTIIPPAAG